jgi:hypothetical protein
MKNLKLLILAFGALGLASFAMELEQLKFLLAHLLDHGGAGLILIAGFVLPTLIGLMALVRPPMEIWQGGACLAGFGAIAIKIRVWELVPRFPDLPLSGQLVIVAIVGGVVVSALSIAKPESSS